MYIYIYMEPDASPFIPGFDRGHGTTNRMSVNSPSFIPGTGRIRESAAKDIQRNVRGSRARRNLTQKKQAASKIQSQVRGNMSRTDKRRGLRYPQYDNFDFRDFQKRIFEESMYGLRDGLYPIKEDIEYQTNRLKDNDKLLEKIQKEEDNPYSKYNIGMKVDGTKKERYLQSEVNSVKEIIDKMKKNPETYRDSGLIETYQKLYGDGSEELIKERLREQHSKPEGFSESRYMGLRNIDPKLADKEDGQQNYYQNIVRDRSIALSNKESAEYNKDFQKQKLEDLERLDLFKCKDIKAMAQADQRLFLDKDFLTNYIKPCRDELTKIYIDTYYSLPFQSICPNPLEIQEMSITNVLNNIPIDSPFTRATANIMKDTLMAMGIMLTPERSIMMVNQVDMYIGLPMDNWYLLSQFYRWAKSGRRTALQHTVINPRFDQDQPNRYPKYPIITGVLVDEQRNRVEIDGREALENTLNLFEDTVRERNLKVDGGGRMMKDDIEKMKRYFILCLIGFKSPWPDRVSDYMNKLDTDILRAKNIYRQERTKGESKKADKTKLRLDKLKLIQFNLKKIVI